MNNKTGGTRCGELVGRRWGRYVHEVLLAEHFGLRSGCRRLSPWGSREFGQRPFRWVCHRGRSDVTPARSHGGDPQRSYPGRAPALAWLPRPPTKWEYPLLRFAPVRRGSDRFGTRSGSDRLPRNFAQTRLTSSAIRSGGFGQGGILSGHDASASPECGSSEEQVQRPNPPEPAHFLRGASGRELPLP